MLKSPSVTFRAVTSVFVVQRRLARTRTSNSCQDLHLLQRVENLSVQQLIPQLRVERFAVAVFPPTAGRDVERLGAGIGLPLPQVLRDELRAIVRTDVFGNALRDHHISQRLNHPGA